MTKRKKNIDEIYLQSLARGYTEASVRALGAWATNDKTSEDTRLRAIGMLLDRGWGKPKQLNTHSGSDGGDITVVIRNIVEGRK